ncbi:hypothetical protein QRO11_10170 [Paracidovorax citrulli]|uniref:hypothetical protein n=1 Tax=Paracidovorax citrulli TaxID=80869 RepID=UPI00255CC1FB|nr:hypothetical protein [Paracidovorax citrulli]WIY36658.1 hypothetical protein QRO11_10170 [Paracidovorax citrulli]
MHLIEAAPSAGGATSATAPTTELFPLGQLTVTQGAAPYLFSGVISALGIVSRHQSGDWGDLCEHDRRCNDHAVRSGGRILSAYRVDGTTRLWVITESDRSVTTVLLPSEY